MNKHIITTDFKVNQFVWLLRQYYNCKLGVSEHEAIKVKIKSIQVIIETKRTRILYYVESRQHDIYSHYNKVYKTKKEAESNMPAQKITILRKRLADLKRQHKENIAYTKGQVTLIQSRINELTK